MVSDQWSVFSDQWSVFSGQYSVVSGQNESSDIFTRRIKLMHQKLYILLPQGDTVTVHCPLNTKKSLTVKL